MKCTAPDHPVAFAQVYSTLGRLEQRGRVRLEGIERAEGPDRRRYAITDEGTRELERWLTEPLEAEPHLQADVLLEIGAAMALYGGNFVLLVEDSVALPLNLQELCECRYRGDELNLPTMMALLRTFSGFTRPRAKAALPAFGHAIASALARRKGAGGSATSPN